MRTKENVSCYQLHSSNVHELRVALDNLKGYHKALSIIYLRMMGYPTLKGVIVTAWDKEAMEITTAFCKENHFEKLLIRIDKIRETGSAPRGGYLVDYQNLEKEVTNYLEEGRIVILLEPMSPYNDLYSINALFAKDREDIVLEIVGPGFDASDLNRGDISPHQILSVSKAISEIPSNLGRILKQLHIVSPEAYKQSVEQRLVKIGMTYARLNVVNVSGWSEKRIAQLGEKCLQESGQTLLLENREVYKPISAKYLKILLPYVIELPEKLQKLGVEVEPTMVLSMSILNENGGRLNFWDIVWPSLKYTGTRKEIRLPY